MNHVVKGFTRSHCNDFRRGPGWGKSQIEGRINVKPNIFCDNRVMVGIAKLTI